MRRIFAIAVVCLMVASMFGNLASSMAHASSSDLPTTIRVKRLALDRVDTVDFELYTKRVLPREWIASWPDESLKAGAVAVKTYAWYWIEQGGRHADADVCDGAHCQVYTEGTDTRTDDAVEATWLTGMRKGGALFNAQYWDGRAVVYNTGGAHLNIREGPGLSYSVKGQANEEDELVVLSNGLRTSDGYRWYFVKTGGIANWDAGSYITGWAAGSYLKSYWSGQNVDNYYDRMTQWGSKYWADPDQGKDYQWILSYFYPDIQFFGVGGQPSPVITSSLTIIESEPYYVGDTISARFTIENKGTAAITFDVLTVGGRDPDDQVADFTFHYDITLNPSDSYDYQGALALSKVGNHHFFCAYYIENPTPQEEELLDDNNWNTSVPTDPGVSNTLDIWVEAATTPQVTTTGASSITTSSAALWGNLDSTGGLDCQVWFEYGTTTSYGSSTPELSMSSAGPFGTIISSLSPDTTYHFRACASNSEGTRYGSDMTFKTEKETYPPEVTTTGASSITTSSAALWGNLDSTGGLDCQVWFEYGTTTSYGSSTPELSMSSAGPFGAIISSLSPDTTYHFRACASNSEGTRYGSGMTFTTITGQVVTFPDPNLETAIREAIGKPTGDIYQSDLQGLTELHAIRRNISDLTGLEYCVNLALLRLWENQISDISPLANLTSLTLLTLDGNQISDIQPLANLTSLTHLDLGGNQISDISPLANLTNVTYLDLWNNQLSNILPLANLTSLTLLTLDENQISDISPLANLTSLTLLTLDGNQISDIQPLANLTSLTHLDLGWNQISDVSPLPNLTSLTELHLEHNQISDISPLANLTSLTLLKLWGNQVSDISPLVNLTRLTVLYLWGNQISHISPLANLTSLTWLDLHNNQISDISPLLGNPELSGGDTVDLRINPLSPTSINIYIPQLQERGVNILYDAPKTWYVDDDRADYPAADFTKIQDAVNAASPGDIIIVYPGTYTENVNVNKDHLIIKSENGAEVTTVQAASPNDHVFEVTADYVSINRFTVRGATGRADGSVCAGIYLRGTDSDNVQHCNISGNKVSNNYDGISLWYSSNNVLHGNTASSNTRGIMLIFSSNNTLRGNIASSNNWGIYLHLSSNNTLIDNTMSDNEFNLMVIGSNLSEFTQNIDTPNMINGKPVQYLVDKHDLTIDASWDVGYLGLVNCTNMIVRDLTLSNNGQGLLLAYTSDSRIEGLNVSDNSFGIYSNQSLRNVFTGNMATSNGVGFALGPSDNMVYLNSFINNYIHNASSGSGNTWNSPEELIYTYNGIAYANYLGNYWSDYAGSDADGDGIGETPYMISSDSDNYPLMEPFENYQQVLERTVRIYTRPYVPIGEVKVTYNQVGEDTYTVSEIDFRAIGFSGVSRVLIFDDTEVKWSDQMFILPGGPYAKTYVAPFGGEFPEGITVHRSDAVGLRLIGIDVITASVNMVKKPTDWLLTKLPYIGPILDAFDVDLETILSAVGADPWKYPTSFTESSSCQFDPESTETPSVPGEELLQLLGAMMFSPSELRIYDTQGRVTGLVNGEARNEIPNSEYQGETVIILSPTDTYRFEIAGTDDGSYGLATSSIQEESSTFKAKDIPTTDHAVHQYTIDWDALSEGEEGVTVNVDSDGDGEFERTLTSDDELTRDEFLGEPSPSPTLPPEEGGGCFIATAAYGSYLDSHVDVLRDFRDQYLMTNPIGSSLVSLYYKLSPPVAQLINDYPALQPIVRAGLLPAVAISMVAVNTTLAETMAIVGALALVSILLVTWARRRRGKGSAYS